MVKRVLTTVLMLALYLCSGIPSAQAFSELAVATQECCCSEETSSAASDVCSISIPCDCNVSDSGTPLPSKNRFSAQSADEQPLPRQTAFTPAANVRVVDACTIRGAQRKPLHLASNKVYLKHRALLI